MCKEHMIVRSRRMWIDCLWALQVLHALLEPEEPQQIAVVGISNWSLDAAKMNRAIHLSQPDPSEDDLYQTSLAILESYDTSGGLLQSLKGDLMNLSRAYYDYHSCQSQQNFHGLRDFYSLIKSLRVTRSTLSWQLDGLVTAVWRNFGGSPNDVETFSQILKENLELESLLQQPPPVLDLVLENLQDKDARHLMLITMVFIFFQFLLYLIILMTLELEKRNYRVQRIQAVA